MDVGSAKMGTGERAATLAFAVVWAILGATICWAVLRWSPPSAARSPVRAPIKTPSTLLRDAPGTAAGAARAVHPPAGSPIVSP